MNGTLEHVDSFDYKGRIFNVSRDEDKKYYFQFDENGEMVTISIGDIKAFIDSSFSHRTVDNTTLDLIEKSVKINTLIYHLGDLKKRINKYK